MSEFSFVRNGQLINPPQDWKGLEIEFEWENRQESLLVNISNVVFKGNEAKALIERFNNGMFGGVGIFEGEPLDIVFGDISDPTLKIECYLDGTDELEYIGCDTVSLTLKKVQGTDWLNDVADAFTFRYLYDIGLITDADFVKVPTVKNYVPENTELAMLSISIYMISRELYTLIKDIADATAELINSITPSVGLGVVVDVGDVIWVSLKTIFRIAFAIAMSIALKNLIKDLIEQLLPPVRMKKAMSYLRLMQRGLQHLGLTLQSNLLNSIPEWTLLPTKFDEEKNGTDLGIPGTSDPVDKFGDFIRFLKAKFNADFQIIDGVFIFEQKDYFEFDSGFVIPNTWDDQDLQKNRVKFNTKEIRSNYAISYITDSSDMNTLDNQQGRVFQVTTDAITTNNVKLKTIQGFEEIVIPVSLGIEKQGFTRVENFMLDLAKAVDKLINVFGGSSSLASGITERKNSLLLQNNFTSSMKAIVMNGNKLANNQRELLSAKNLFLNYHKSMSFVEIDGVHNQWKRHINRKIPICLDEISLLLNSNRCSTFDGQKAKIERLKWMPYAGTATVDFRFNEKYTENLKLTYSE
jgi:hypothetical protein